MGERGPQLVQVKAADEAYPLRGRLRVRDGFDAPERAVERGPNPGEIWVESRLLRLLNTQIGDPVGPRRGAGRGSEPS